MSGFVSFVYLIYNKMIKCYGNIKKTLQFVIGYIIIHYDINVITIRYSDMLIPQERCTIYLVGKYYINLTGENG